MLHINSRGAPTTALLLVGAAATDDATPLDGRVLVIPLLVPPLIFPVAVPAGGLALPFDVPCDSTLCGRSIYLQALEFDPAASKGFSFTPGLRLVLGA